MHLQEWSSVNDASHSIAKVPSYFLSSSKPKKNVYRRTFTEDRPCLNEVFLAMSECNSSVVYTF